MSVNIVFWIYPYHSGGRGAGSSGHLAGATEPLSCLNSHARLFHWYFFTVLSSLGERCLFHCCCCFHLFLYFFNLSFLFLFLFFKKEKENSCVRKPVGKSIKVQWRLKFSEWNDDSAPNIDFLKIPHMNEIWPLKIDSSFRRGKKGFFWTIQITKRYWSILLEFCLVVVLEKFCRIFH